MHQLVTILAKKGKQFYRKDAIAKAFCDRYVGMAADNVFDWAVTETAGRWASLYPDNLLEGDDVISRLEDVKEYQHHRMEEIGEEITSIIGNGTIGSPQKDLESTLLWFMSSEQTSRRNGLFTPMNPEFLYLEDGSGTVTPQLINDVRKSPDDYCILLVDAHF